MKVKFNCSSSRRFSVCADADLDRDCLRGAPQRVALAGSGSSGPLCAQRDRVRAPRRGSHRRDAAPDGRESAHRPHRTNAGPERLVRATRRRLAKWRATSPHMPLLASASHRSRSGRLRSTPAYLRSTSAASSPRRASRLRVAVRLIMLTGSRSAPRRGSRFPRTETSLRTCSSSPDRLRDA